MKRTEFSVLLTYRIFSPRRHDARDFCTHIVVHLKMVFLKIERKSRFRGLAARLQGVTHQNIVTFIFTVMRTSNLRPYIFSQIYIYIRIAHNNAPKYSRLLGYYSVSLGKEIYTYPYSLRTNIV